MDTFLQMQTSLQNKLSTNSSSPFYTVDILKDALNTAKSRAEDRYNWQELEKAVMTDTEAGQEYYDYPEQFTTDSLTRLTVDEEPYDLINFDDYLNYKMDYPTSTERLFADYGRQYFIFPTPTVSGNKNISVWGIVKTGLLTLDADETIFSHSNRSGNEGIVKIAYGIIVPGAKNKATGKTEEEEGLALLDAIWSKRMKKQQKYQRKNHPKFVVGDLFAGRSATFVAGNFKK